MSLLVNIARGCCEALRVAIISEASDTALPTGPYWATKTYLESLGAEVDLYHITSSVDGTPPGWEIAPYTFVVFNPILTRAVGASRPSWEGQIPAWLAMGGKKFIFLGNPQFFSAALPNDLNAMAAALGLTLAFDYLPSWFLDPGCLSVSFPAPLNWTAQVQSHALTDPLTGLQYAATCTMSGGTTILLTDVKATDAHMLPYPPGFGTGHVTNLVMGAAQVYDDSWVLMLGSPAIFQSTCSCSSNPNNQQFYENLLLA